MNSVAKKIQTVSSIFLIVSLVSEIFLLLMATAPSGGGGVYFEVNGAMQSSGNGGAAFMSLIIPTIVIFVVYYALRGLAEIIIILDGQHSTLKENNKLMKEVLGKNCSDDGEAKEENGDK